jgi:pimeloyl-ACP methyl ester carboxylesterase
MSGRRAAAIGAGVAAGAVAAGAIGRTLVRRRHSQQLGEQLWDLPPQDLGVVRSFDGTSIAVRAAGDPGLPALLFVHGFSLDMTIWHEQWVDLSVDHRCILMDLRGHGSSGPPAGGDLSLGSMARDVAAVLDAVSPEAPVVAIGHSMGGMALLALAEQRPELLGDRVRGLVLVGTASADLLRGAMGSLTDLMRPRFGSISAAARRVDRLRKAVLASPGDLRGAAVRLTQFGADAQPHLVEHVVRLAERASSHVWTDGLAGLMELDLRHALPRVTVPALVVVGEHDRVTPPASAVALTGTLPDGRLVVLEGAGHVAMMERPDDLDRTIRTFARSVFAPDGRTERRRTTRRAGAARAKGRGRS